MNENDQVEMVELSEVEEITTIEAETPLLIEIEAQSQADCNSYN